MIARAAIALSLAGLLWAPLAVAAPCGRPDIDLTFPPQGASGVPSNAALSAHYASPAVYDDEAVSLTDAAGDAVELAVAFDAAEARLLATPSAPLAEGEYQLAWPGLRGVGGGVGRGSNVDFTVSSDVDATAPSFAGLTGIDWDLSRERDACTDKLEDRFTFRLKVGHTSDDSPAALLALLVFETRDPNARASGEPKPVALRAYPANGVVELMRPTNHAGETCFAALTRDLLGNVSGGGDRQVCIKTKEPPFFDGCALGRAPNSNGAYLALGLACGLLRRGRHARSPRRSLA